MIHCDVTSNLLVFYFVSEMCPSLALGECTEEDRRKTQAGSLLAELEHSLMLLNCLFLCAK